MKKEEGKEKDKEREAFNFVIFAVFALVFILIFYYFISTSPTYKEFFENPEIKVSRNLSSYEEFAKNLYNSDSLSIVMDITNSIYNEVIFNCGVGLSQSWGAIGKNISKLHIYVINGSECYYSNPEEKKPILKSNKECYKEYENGIYFYISYGPQFSYFLNNSAHIYVDENYKGPCSFQLISQLTNESKIGSEISNETK